MDFLNEITPVIIIAATAIAICVGSFLNVIIMRIPKMLEQQYKTQAYDILDIPLSNRDSLNISSASKFC